MADPAPGDLFQTYDPKGADSGLFAPAYIAGFQPSQDAVAAWNAQNHVVTPSMMDQLQMPAQWQAPQTQQSSLGTKALGAAGNIPQNQSFGQPQVDPNALRALAQGGPYDVQARRDAIAQRLAANAAAQAAYTPPATNNFFGMLGAK